MNYKRITDMSNFKPEFTGLSFRIYVSNSLPRDKPRLKVYDKGYEFSMYISDNPTVSSGSVENIKAKNVEELKEWIILNKQVLLDYWNDKIDTVELVSKLKRL